MTAPDLEPFLVADIDELVPELVGFAWRDWVPWRAVTVVDGDTGVGKTVALLDVVVRWACGFPMPDGSDWHGDAGVAAGTGVNVLYVGLDDGVRGVLAARVRAAMGAYAGPRGRILLWNEGQALSLPNDEERLELTVRAHGVRVVVVDTLVRATDGLKELGDYQHASQVMGALDNLARVTGAAVLVVNHVTKVQGATSLSRGYGSKGGVNGTARSVISAQRNADAERGDSGGYLEVVKSNYGPLPAPLAYHVRSAWVDGVNAAGAPVELKTATCEWAPGSRCVAPGRAARSQKGRQVADEDAVARQVLGGDAVTREAMVAGLLAGGVSELRLPTVIRRVAASQRVLGGRNEYVWTLKPEYRAGDAVAPADGDGDGWPMT